MISRTWRIAGNEVVPIYGNVITNVHLPYDCAGRPCVIHRPTNHRMRRWPLLWRDDRGIFERTCPHGVGHPDPDQQDYWRSKGELHQMVHGCDGCCIGNGPGKRKW